MSTLIDTMSNVCSVKKFDMAERYLKSSDAVYSTAGSLHSLNNSLSSIH